MNNKERAAMQAAWVWMDWYSSNNGTLEPVDFNETITALREALAEQAEQEPVAWAHPSGGHLSARYMKEFATGLEKETHTIPLYAAPVRTKDLTDAFINELHKDAQDPISFARAVIAADREKNSHEKTN